MTSQADGHLWLDLASAEGIPSDRTIGRDPRGTGDITQEDRRVLVRQQAVDAKAWVLCEVVLFMTLPVEQHAIADKRSLSEMLIMIAVGCIAIPAKLTLRLSYGE